MGHHKWIQYMHYRGFSKRTERKREENLFKEIMTKNFQNLGSEVILGFVTLKDSQTVST